jgi:hypothetical protein
VRCNPVADRTSSLRSPKTSLARHSGRRMTGEHRWALYDLNACPPSFDFLTFLVLAKYHGATAVWFVPGICRAKLFQYTEQEQKRRVQTILLPACRMYGLPFKFEELGGKSPADYDFAWPPFIRSGKALDHGYAMGWLKSIKEPEPFMPSAEALLVASKKLNGKSLVVHLRKTEYQAARNSSEDWERWAKNHNAYIVPDEIDLDERAAFHELAQLNVGVVSGPFVLSVYSKHRPYIILKHLAGEISTNKDFLKKQGFYSGDQYHWGGHHQMIVWNDKDDYQTIETAYQQWLANNPERNSLCQKNNNLELNQGERSAGRKSEREEGQGV